MRIRSFLPLAAAAAASALAAPAFAAPSIGHGGAATRAHASPLARASVPTVKNDEFAGYEVEKTGGKTTITTTFVVPKLRCTKAERAIAPSAGIDNEGTQASSANLFVGCYKGKAKYFPWFFVNGTETNLTKVAAHSGDKIVLQLSVTTSATKVSVVDKTRKHRFTKTEKGAGYTSFTEYPWIGEVGWDNTSGLTGVPSFGKISFTASKLSGHPFGSASHLYRFNRYNSTETTLQIKMSPFASNHESFKALFKHS